MQTIKVRSLFIEKEIDWKCPRCKSKSIALDTLRDHQHFEDQYRELKQLMRCCNCGQQFIFEYKLESIELHSFRPYKEE